MTAAPPRTITELRSDSEGGTTSCWLINSFCWIVLMKPFSDIRALMYRLMDWAASNDRKSESHRPSTLVPTTTLGCGGEKKEDGN